MENRIENIVTGANEVVNRIYEKIGEIDNCKAVLKNLEEADVSLLMPDGNMAELRPALDDEQLADVKLIIGNMVNARIECAAEFLERVSGAKVSVPDPVTPEEEAPVMETAAEEAPVMEAEPESASVTEPVQEFKCAEAPEPKLEGKKPGRNSRMTVPEVEQLLRDGYTFKDIADKYGYKSETTVMKFIEQNKIKVAVLTQGNNMARELTEKDIPQIRALYTNGPFNLTETAAELKTTKKKLREFVEKNHLLKPVAVR